MDERLVITNFRTLRRRNERRYVSEKGSRVKIHGYRLLEKRSENYIFLYSYRERKV